MLKVKEIVSTARLEQMLGSTDPSPSEIHDIVVELINWRRASASFDWTATVARDEIGNPVSDTLVWTDDEGGPGRVIFAKSPQHTYMVRNNGKGQIYVVLCTVVVSRNSDEKKIADDLGSYAAAREFVEDDYRKRLELRKAGPGMIITTAGSRTA